jgi:hypothetical protein
MGDKKGQVTIFIILAIVIVVGAVLAYLFLPGFGLTTGLTVDNPQAFIDACMEDEIELTVETISTRGGSLEPAHFFTYYNTPVEYLCYINQDYIPCIVQQPLLINHIKSELDESLQPVATSCFNDLKETYEEKGYTVEMKQGKLDTEFKINSISFNFPGYELVVKKGETLQFDSFNIVLNNNLYELATIANNIVSWEATYGDAETTMYMTYYPNIKVEKKKQGDGTTIYIITNRNTKDKFQFASRSLVFPPGYSI